MNDKTRFVVYVFLSLIFIVVAVSCYQSLLYFKFFDTQDYVISKGEYVKQWWWKTIFYTHISFASIALFVGFFQFISVIRQRRKNIHKAFGYIYLTSVVFFAAPTSVLLASFPLHQPGVFLAFIVKSLSWMLFGILAFIFVKRGNYWVHSQWMIRSYAMALTSVTVRLLHGIFEKGFGLAHADNLYISLWLSFVLNLVIAEIIILIRKFRTNEI